MNITRRATTLPILYRLAVLTALAVLVTVPATAQPFDDGDWEIGVDFGLTDWDRNISDDDSGTRYGIRVGRFMTDHFELELQYFEMEADETGVDVESSNFFVNGLWNFYPNDNLGLYTLLGIGTSDFDVRFVDRGRVFRASDDGFAFQAAIGLRFFFADEDRGNFRLELSSMTEDSFSSTSSHLSLTAGLGWRFGGY